MIIIPVLPPRYERKKKSTVPPQPPVLVAATYAPETHFELTFDRAVDVAGLDPAEFFVDDAGTTHLYQGDAATPLSPARVRVSVSEAGDSSGTGVHLDVGAGNGIAAIDGAAWAGVTGLALPFG